MAPFTPVALDFGAQRAEAERLGALWTPTTLFCDPDGRERHRVTGFWTAPEFVAQARLGLGRVRYAQERWDEAESLFAEIVARHAPTEAAPEAQYWLGATRYRRDPKSGGLREAWEELATRWPASPWTTRAWPAKSE